MVPVLVDPAAKTITIFARYLWLFRFRREFQFSEVQAVVYGDSNESMSSDSSASDSADSFYATLLLKDRSQKHLFYFIGNGTFTNNSEYPDWMFARELAFDSSGSQENESRAFVDRLAKLIGVKVVPPPSDY